MYIREQIREGRRSCFKLKYRLIKGAWLAVNQMFSPMNDLLEELSCEPLDPAVFSFSSRGFNHESFFLSSHSSSLFILNESEFELV